MTSLLVLMRALSALFNYLIVRITSVSEYAAISNFVAISNFCYQTTRLGYEYEFQRQLNESAEQSRWQFLNTIFFVLVCGLSFVSAFLAYIILTFGYSSDSNTLNFSFLSILFFCASLFFNGFFWPICTQNLIFVIWCFILPRAQWL